MWKSYGKIDQSRSKKQYRFLTEFYAKFIGLLISHQIMIISFWQHADRSLFKAIKIIQQNISILAYSFSKGKTEIVDSIEFISKSINQCRIDKRNKKPATFQLLLNIKHLKYA